MKVDETVLHRNLRKKNIRKGEELFKVAHNAGIGINVAIN